MTPADNGHTKEWLSFHEALFRYLPQRVFLKDCLSNYIYCNHTLARDYGIQPEEITGRTDYDFLPAELADKYKADDRWIIENNQAVETEEEYSIRGKKVWVRTNKIPVHDSMGQVIGVLGMFWDITPEKHTRDALQISEEKLRAIIEQSADAILLVNPEGILIDFNKQACHTFEISPYSGRAKPVSQIHPQLRQFFSLLKGQPDMYSREYVNKKSHPGCVFELRGNCILIAGDLFYLITAHDISARKNAEAEVLKLNEVLEKKVMRRTSELQKAIFRLSETEQRYRNMFHNNHVVMILVEPQTGTIVDANAAAELFYGYRLDVLKKMNVTEINTLSAQEVQVEMERARSMQRNWFEFKHRLANGDIKDVEVHSGPMVDNNRTLLFSIVHDVTARKLVERALVASDRRFRMLVDQAPFAIEIYDISGYLIQINTTCCQLFGLAEPRDKIYKFNILSDEMQLSDKYKAAYQEALLGVPSVIEDFDTKLISRNNEKIFLHSYVYPLIDEEQNVRNVVFVHDDITLRKRVEKMFKASVDLTLQFDHLTMDKFIVAALDAGVEITDSQIGFFHFINPDEKTIRLQAWSTHTQKICHIPDKDEHYPVERAGVWVDCIHQRQAVIHNEYPQLPGRKGLPQGHVELFREMVVPVFENDKIVCVFGVGNKSTHYTQFDVDLLTYHANSTWQAIQRRKAEKALRTSEERYRMIIENMSDFIYSIHMVPEKGIGNFEWIIGPIEEITGYGCDQINDMKEGLRSIIVAEDLRKYKETIDYILQGETDYLEHRIIKNTGEIRWLRNYMKPIADAETGNVVRILGGVQDITERKLAEEQMIKLAAKQIVLLREVNHRVKNNLSALISMLHIEEDRAQQTNKNDLVPVLSNITSKLQGLLTVHSMLSASNWQPLVLTELAVRLINSLVSSVSSREIELKCSGDSVLINSNQAHHLTIIINELVTNTIKYGLSLTQMPVIRFEVSLKKDMIQISYSDNGSGFPQQLIDSDFSLTNIGINLISGIVTHSLEGVVYMYNHEGAVTQITLPLQTTTNAN